MKARSAIVEGFLGLIFIGAGIALLTGSVMTWDRSISSILWFLITMFGIVAIIAGCDTLWGLWRECRFAAKQKRKDGKALSLFFGLLAIFAGAWISYVVKDGCFHAVAQITAGTIVLIGISLIIRAFRRNKNSLLPG